MKIDINWKKNRFRIVNANTDEEYHVRINMLRDVYGTEYDPPKKVYDHMITIVNASDEKRFTADEEGIYEFYLIHEDGTIDLESVKRGYVGQEHWFELSRQDDESCITYTIQTDIDLNSLESGSISSGGLVYYDGKNYLPLPTMVQGKKQTYEIRVIVERQDASEILLDPIWKGAVAGSSVGWIKGE